MRGGRHAAQPSESANLSIADIIAARNDFHRTRRRPDAQIGDDTGWQRPGAILVTATLVGFVLGGSVPPEGPLKGWRGRVSDAFGWAYLTSWAFAESSAIHLHLTRNTAAGSLPSLDHLIYIIIGDVAYTAFTTVLLWSPVCRASGQGCVGKRDSLHLNDALYAIFSTLCAAALFYPRLKGAKRKAEVSLQCWVLIVSVLVIGGGGLLLALQDSSYLTLPGFLYGVSFLRLVSCALLRMPPRRTEQPSDAGSQQHLLTVADSALVIGGIASLAQQGTDVASLRSWPVLTSNLTKLLLALLSIAFGVTQLLRDQDALFGWRLIRIERGKMAPRTGASGEPEENLSEALITQQ